MKHASVPYYSNPNNMFCALACYTMIGQYLLPDKDITFEMFGELADYKDGCIVWPFPVWKWMMDYGIHIADFDAIDYNKWVRDGVDGLKRTVAPEEFDFYQKNTSDLNVVSEQIAQVDNHPNFTYTKKQVTWSDMVTEYNKPGICDLTLNSKALNRQEGLDIHRVVLLDINDTHVTIHDPNVAGDGVFRRVKISHFRKAIEGIENPEVCRYWV